MAAPGAPSLKIKMKTGSRIRLAAAPMTTDNIPVVEYPWALMKGFIPVVSMEGKVPKR